MFTMRVPLGPALLACLLATFAPHPGLSLNILKVSLEGGGDDYLEVGAKANYVLNCEYRTPYDDPVKEVIWKRFGVPFYKWVAIGSPTVLDAAFLGKVDTAPEKNPHNVHFTPPLDYSLAGDYVCQVSTAAATTEASYTLLVVDGGSWPVLMRVRTLAKIKEELEMTTNSSNTDNDDENMENMDGASDQNKYDIEQNGENDADAEVMFEDEDCTLVWDLATPAIYPRPNVTCGHYSFDHGDIVERLPAGLTLHKYPNGSWVASFHATHIQVSSLPKSHRLGCSIQIPGTSYKKVARPKDDLRVESLIDAGGCPGFQDVQGRGIIVKVKDATHTCRGDVLPADRSGLALASLSCPEGHIALFPDNPRRRWSGSLELSCAENDVGWRLYDPDETTTLGDLVNPDSLPVCVPGASGAGPDAGRLCSSTLAAALLLSWLLRA